MTFELSVIIPLINEAQAARSILEELASQRNCNFEILFCDGGSQDETLDILADARSRFDHRMKIVRAGPGRGRQMNAGFLESSGSYLLFLHVDSRFRDPYALAGGLEFFHRNLIARRTHRLAARFALKFDRCENKPSFGYYFYESKARLNLPGCIHGDQGFLLPRRFFQEVGPFDEKRPFLEDEALAAPIFLQGQWLLLPVTIFSSARRFEREGLLQRQSLNALIMNFYNVGWDQFIDDAPEIYRQQSIACRLDLLPFLVRIQEHLKTIGAADRKKLLCDTGRYVRSQAWQIVFGFLAMTRYHRNKPPSGSSFVTAFHSLWERASDFRPINWFTGRLTLCCFRLALSRLRRRSNRTQTSMDIRR